MLGGAKIEDFGGQQTSPSDAWSAQRQEHPLLAQNICLYGGWFHPRCAGHNKP